MDESCKYNVVQKKSSTKGHICFIPLMYKSKTDKPNYGIGSQDKGYPWGTEIGG